MPAAMLTFLARHVALILSLSLSAGQLPVFGPEVISIGAFLSSDSSVSEASSIKYVMLVWSVERVNILSVCRLKLLIFSEEVRRSSSLVAV